MKRFKLKNKKNGLQFEIQGDALGSRQPEWGPAPQVKLKAQCDEWELASGAAAGQDEQGRDLWSVPDALEVVEENIDAEIAASADKKQKAKEAFQRLKDYDEDTATAAQRKQFFKDLQRVIRWFWQQE